MILCVRNGDPRLKIIKDYISNYTKVKCVEEFTSNDEVNSIILPVQGISDDFLIYNTNIDLRILLQKVKPRKIYTGLISKTLMKICDQYNIEIVSYLSEEVSYKNTLLTSEGLLKILYERGLSISNKRTLITGYGRLTANIANIFDALNSDVTIYARKEKDRVSAKLLGYKTIKDLNDLSLENYQIIINTVPHIIFTENQKKYLKPDANLIDLASKPGGFSDCYDNVIQELGIPGRMYPYESGILMAKFISDDL